MKNFLTFISILFVLLPIRTLATSGFLRKDTIKECEGNLYGQHGSDNHWHIAIKNENGSYSATGDVLPNNPCPLNDENNTNSSNIDDKTVAIPQNSDSSLKEIIIGNEKIDIKETMEYKTTKEKIALNIIANNEKAKVEYNKIDNLELGNNIVNIKVTAIDGNITKYVLIIVRERALDTNTGIEVKIAGETVEFADYKYNLEVKNSTNSLDIDYTLDSESSKVIIEGNEKFVTGKNEVKIIVTAEDGTKQEYIIIVTKLDWFNSIIKIILGSSVVVAIIAFIKKIFSK
ncbi:MAG: cadherin-like beta sandwich domain-containing protein [Bacilli bacterium]|nr:cadherin-like beta sandwich domain-containing protein [Bacilli bacterium]